MPENSLDHASSYLGTMLSVSRKRKARSRRVAKRSFTKGSDSIAETESAICGSLGIEKEGRENVERREEGKEGRKEGRKKRRRCRKEEEAGAPE